MPSPKVSKAPKAKGKGKALVIAMLKKKGMTDPKHDDKVVKGKLLDPLHDDKRVKPGSKKGKDANRRKRNIGRS